MQTTKYVRKAFAVEAVQVTDANMAEAAEWCGGTVVPSTTDQKDSFIKVPVHRPLNEKQTKAYPGDWLLKAETGFKVYTNRAFINSFEKLEEPIVYTDADADAQLKDDEDDTEKLLAEMHGVES